MNGIERIAAERQRQIEVEDWSISRDLELYPDSELAFAAACYAVPRGWVRGQLFPLAWPWGDEWWKPVPDNRIRELEKAGALIAAEIDRLQASSRDAKEAREGL